MRITTLIAAMVAAVPVATVAEETRIDPLAAEIALAAAGFLAAQSDFAFNWFASYDDVVDGRQKITFLRSGHTVMARGQGFLSRTERDDTLRDYYYDGAVFTVASPNEHFYASAPFAGGFDALVNEVRARTGAILPLWSIMSETLPRGLLDEVESADYLGVVLIAGREAHHLAFTEPEEDWQLWVSTDEAAPLPLMLVGTEKREVGWPQYQVYMMDWNLDPDVDPAQFRFVPGDADIRVTFPSLVSRAGATEGAAPSATGQ